MATFLGTSQLYIIISCLVIFLIFCVVLLFTYAKENEIWRLPPQSCPDYWVEEAGQCYNIKGMGKCSSQNIGEFSETDINMNVDKNKYYFMDFDTLDGGNTSCNKQKWANKCGISWDGITYGYGKTNPCST